MTSCILKILIVYYFRSMEDRSSAQGFSPLSGETVSIVLSVQQRVDTHTPLAPGSVDDGTTCNYHMVGKTVVSLGG